MQERQTLTGTFIRNSTRNESDLHLNSSSETDVDTNCDAYVRRRIQINNYK